MRRLLGLSPLRQVIHLVTLVVCTRQLYILQQCDYQTVHLVMLNNMLCEVATCTCHNSALVKTVECVVGCH